MLREPRPGDMGWVVQSHGAFYAREYGFDSSFEGLVAEIAAKFLASFDASRERCWIADIDGTQVGSIFLVQAYRRRRQTPAAAGRAGRARTGIRPAAGRRMHRVRESLRLSPDHAVDPEHSGCRPQDLSGGRVQAGRHRAAPQFRPRPDRRNLGTGTVKPARRDTSRRVTPDLLDFYIKRAHALREEWYRNMCACDLVVAGRAPSQRVIGCPSG